jgi:hypothetical protein
MFSASLASFKIDAASFLVLYKLEILLLFLAIQNPLQYL